MFRVLSAIHLTQSDRIFFCGTRYIDSSKCGISESHQESHALGRVQQFHTSRHSITQSLLLIFLDAKDPQQTLPTQDSPPEKRRQNRKCAYMHACLEFGYYAILALSFGLAPDGGIHMQFVNEKPPETQYTTRPGARAKRREVALAKPGFEPRRVDAWLSLRPSQGHPCRCEHGR
jgi:hypothetical protein